MKKTLFFIASMVLLASCTKTVAVSDDKGGHTEASAELTLTTITNTTKAITEGTRMPTDNAIGFYPRFHSDISTADFSSSNKYGLFGYDAERGVWRNLDRTRPVTDIDNIEDYFPAIPYNFSPMYWPAGDRVFMDYVACSYSNLLAQFSTVDDNRPLRVEAVTDNPNRMHVRYEYNVPFGELMPEDAILGYSDLASVGETLFILKMLGYDTGIGDNFITELEQLLDKYEEAVEVLENEDYDIMTANYLEGDTEIPARL